jgi:hypothetical protein
VEQAFHAYVLREGLDALLAEAQAGDEGAREEALRQISAIGASAAASGVNPPKPDSKSPYAAARLSLPSSLAGRERETAEPAVFFGVDEQAAK